MEQVKLKDLANIEISGVDKKTNEREKSVSLCNFVDVYYNWAITKDMTPSLMKASANDKEIEKFTIKKGQVALTKDSETRYDIGIPSYIADDFENVILGYHCALITVTSDRLDSKYLNALFNTDYARKYFANNASGSGQRYTLNASVIEDFPVLLSDISEQKAIGNFLSSIDRKIAVNRKMNEKLEAMAKQIYDYWFVQFDFPNEEGKPYKSSGGKMVWNEKLKRVIPEGWNLCPISKWLEIKSGFAFKSEKYKSSGKYKVITIKNVQDNHLITSNCDFVDDLPVGIKDWCILKVGDRLISLTGNCGRLCIVTEENLLLNQRVGLLSCDSTYLDYAYLMLNSDEFQKLCGNLAKGAAQANLSPVELCKTVSAVPPIQTLQRFHNKIQFLIETYILNEKQISKIINLRDYLLPLLMNGQVKINK